MDVRLGDRMELRRSLGLLHVFCIAAGAMISSGLFVLPGVAFRDAGPAVFISYFLAGALAATGALSTAELATAMPKAGSDYFFITRGMGPLVGTVAALFNWVSFSLKSAFALVGMGALVRLLAPIDMRLTGVVLGLLFVAINLVGIREAARLQAALVVGLLAIMAWYVVRGLPAVDFSRFAPFAPNGAGAVFATAGLVFVSYGGLLKIASVAEEIRNPGRTIPAGMLLALAGVGALYGLMVFVTVGVVPPQQLSGTLTPIADGAAALMGRAGQIALGLAATLAFLTTANAGIMAGSRYLLAMSRDGMMPRSIARVCARFRTPHVAIVLTGALVIVPLFIDLYFLVEAASVGLSLTNILTNLAVIVLRESGVQNYRPIFRTPLYPWVQLAGVLGFAYVLFQMGIDAFVVSAGLALAGFALYWFYGRARVLHDSALLHLLERLTARELVTGSLEAELKEIIRERDAIVGDRFDRLIEGSVVLDIEEEVSLEDFFRRVAAELAPRLKANPAALYERLIAREGESSTILSPGLAIPHIVVQGQHTFDILLARAAAGIRFATDAPPVHCVFVLVGSKDERNFHLRALSAIAQVAQNPAFEAKWHTARDAQALRDLVLLSERQRHA